MPSIPNFLDETAERPWDASVVFLVNFLAPNHFAVCRELASQVRQFTILSSVEMEGNRDWGFDSSGLDLCVQKTWTLTRQEKHPSGFCDVNYIHVPVDTVAQLRRLQPDVIVSLELGARTAFAALYRNVSRRSALVTSIYASERSEAGRGLARRAVRRRLVRSADWLTYNGPSCKKYLRSLGANEQKMSSWDYAADPKKIFQGEICPGRFAGSQTEIPISLLTVGQLSERKGTMLALQQLSDWARDNPAQKIRWRLIGNGPLESALREAEKPSNLAIEFLGHCDPESLRDHYAHSSVLLFPTLGDEWGLVVDEAMHSGLCVLASVHSQAATTLIDNGTHGFLYDPEESGSFCRAMDRLVGTQPQELFRIATAARSRVSDRTAQTSARQLLHAIKSAHARRFRSKSSLHVE